RYDLLDNSRNWRIIMKSCRWLISAIMLLGFTHVTSADDPPKGFTSLFNSKDFTGWKVPAGDKGHWKILDGGIIDYDAKSESKEKDKSLWTAKSYKNFTLRIDWLLKKDKGYMNQVPVILPDGSHKQGADGKDLKVEIEDVDSGIYLRGSSK